MPISPYPCTASGQLQKVERVKIMDKKTGNCTNTKAGITVKAVFDGTQSGQQAFGTAAMNIRQAVTVTST